MAHFVIRPYNRHRQLGVELKEVHVSKRGQDQESARKRIPVRHTAVVGHTTHLGSSHARVGKELIGTKNHMRRAC